MTESRFEVVRFGAGFDRSQFNCGITPLDQYIRQQAGQDVRRGVAAVYLLIDRTNGKVAGYFSLSATAIEFDLLGRDESRRLPRYRLLPACLIGRLATDLEYQGNGVGRLLLVSALRRAAELSHDIGVIAIVVDAIDDRAASFYEYFGFRPLGEPEQQKLYLLISEVSNLG